MFPQDADDDSEAPGGGGGKAGEEEPMRRKRQAGPGTRKNQGLNSRTTHLLYEKADSQEVMNCRKHKSPLFSWY